MVKHLLKMTNQSAHVVIVISATVLIASVLANIYVHGSSEPLVREKFCDQNMCGLPA